jgi:transposase-like protein
VPKPYPPAFRRQALDLVASGRTARDVAASLGIAESCLYRWKSRELIDRGLKAGIGTRESTELAAARRRIRDLEDEVKILRKAAAAVEEVVPPKVRFRLVAELAADGVRVEHACLTLGVSRSGYYEAKSRAPSARAIRHAWLGDLIAAVHQASRMTYGGRRVHAELVHGQGVRGWLQHGHLADAPCWAGRATRAPQGKTTAAGGGGLGSGQAELPPGRPKPAVGHRYHRTPHPGGQALLLRCHRHLLPPGRGLGHRLETASRPGHQRTRHGNRGPRGRGRRHHPRRPRHARRIQLVVATPRSWRCGWEGQRDGCRS